MLPDLSIRQLEYLVAAADASTWSEAAEQVGVSASALSQGLAELERRLGVDLFEPDGRRRRLRPAAQPVLAHARHVLALTADLIGWSQRMSSGRAGRVRVGMIDVAAVDHFPDVIASFRADRPDVELSLRVEPSFPLLEALRRAELDVVVCVEPPAAAGVTLRTLVSEPMFVHAPPGTPRSTLNDPARWGPWVTFPSNSNSRRLITAALTQLGVTPVVVAESHQPEVLREMVRLGFGWTVLPAVETDERLVIGREVVGRDLVVARRTAAVVDPAADDLVDALVAAVPSGYGPN